MDSGNCFRKNMTSTKNATIEQYVDYYAGIDPELHSRYSMVMTLTFVSASYGMTLPLLFPLTAFCFFNLYVTERIKYAYFYRKPALFNNDLNDKVYNILEKAPLFMIVFGFWQLGNRQMFFNETTIMEKQGQIFRAHHHWFDYSQGVDHTLFLIIFFPFFLFFRQFTNGFIKCLECLQIFSSRQFQGKAFLNENLGNYWQCIIGQEQKRWFTKETHLRKELNIKQMDD